MTTSNHETIDIAQAGRLGLRDPRVIVPGFDRPNISLRVDTFSKKDEKRDSTLQKIAKLDIKGRIALAMRGSKEDRSILIRDL